MQNIPKEMSMLLIYCRSYFWMHGRDTKSGEEYIMVTANQRVIMFTDLFCEDLSNTREVRMKENVKI